MKELRGTDLKLKLWDAIRGSIHSIPDFDAIIYFLIDPQNPSDPFTLDEELLLRKRVIEYYGNVQYLFFI